jgi:HEAT repeat protein
MLEAPKVTDTVQRMNRQVLFYLGVFIVSYTGFVWLKFSHQNRTASDVQLSKQQAITQVIPDVRSIDSFTRSESAVSTLITPELVVTTRKAAEASANKIASPQREPETQRAIDNPSPVLRRVALQSLAHGEPSQEAFVTLRSAIESDSDVVNRERAINVLSTMYDRHGDNTGQIRSILSSALQDSNPRVSQRAKFALEKIGS